MKIYIAGKITKCLNFKAKFGAAEEKLCAEGHIVMNPAVLPGRFDFDDYMHICYAMIDVCDAVYFLDNWQDSRGAKLEMEYSIASGKMVLFEAMQAENLGNMMI
ncbi:protein of unknown function [Anaerovirgula multivorans]|uniref:DUF4406 domain-containing protein n=1 Tax=Anaerovirgula multivorans TaxID=312168 RepID=A0A239CRK2_9FIRM|nr:DUF4406 domain-containing protein [Anaerovirgula multivorans]SNS22569.1 protein of unknown function [Anaerovirgula multivorans]